MSHTLIVIFSSSIVIAAVLGWIRFKRIDPTFFPFIYCLWLGTLNEAISFFITLQGESTAINNNLYVLCESLLLIWLFYNWKSYPDKFFMLFFILTLSFAWIIENFLIFSIRNVSSYFRILYSFLIVCLSVLTISKLIARHRNNLIRNASFLICTGLIIYYTYKILVETFWLYGLNASRDFRMRVYFLLFCINLITNLIFAFAVLCMPRKQPFTMRSS